MSKIFLPEEIEEQEKEQEIDVLGKTLMHYQGNIRKARFFDKISGELLLITLNIDIHSANKIKIALEKSFNSGVLQGRKEIISKVKKTLE